MDDDKSKCTMPSTFFNSLPNHIVTFTYDAVVAMGLSACNLLTSGADKVFSGIEHRNSFFNMSKKFRGASGEFELRKDFPTRTADSSYFVMVNLIQNEVNDTHISFQNSPLSSYWNTESTKWQLFMTNEWLYSDGTKDPPKEVENTDESMIEKYWVPVSISIAISCFLSGIAALIYIRKRHKNIESIWSVDMDDVEIDDPPKIIGRGTFGLVVLGIYRGTEVACKRVIPTKEALKCGVASRKLFSHSHGSRESIDIEHGFASKETFRDNSNNGRRFSFKELGSMKRPRKSKIFSKVIGSFQDEHACMRNDFIKEMQTLSKLRHPRITTVMGAVIDGIHEPMLIMEFMEHGSLFDIIHNKTTSFDGEIILPLLCDVASGMRYLHTAVPQIIHGDLKSANVLVDKNMRAKIADFGLTQKQRVGVTGTPYWMSPELLRGESGNTSSSDVYSFGIILYEVFARKIPYDGEDFNYVISEIINSQKRPIMPANCPSSIKAMMQECVAEDPSCRPAFDEIDLRLKRIDDEAVAIEKNGQAMNSKRRNSAMQRTDNLLFDVFPKHIAEALRDGKKVEPEERDDVTIFFSDIVGFTTISSTLSPLLVSEMLDRLYHSFDELSRKHDVFKVETIGDAYMCCSGLVKDQSDHTKRIAQFAIDALDVAHKTLINPNDPSLGYLDLRIGFHTGPVVANVVGSRNPRYCLFGDTVNTASRMESTSTPGRIQCSESAALCLREQEKSIPLKNRGLIKVKGKGEMITFWVNE